MEIYKTRKINIVTYNIHCVPPMNYNNIYINKISKYIYKLVYDNNIDIIILTECFLDNIRKIILKRLNSKINIWKSTKNEKIIFNIFNHGIVIIWKKQFKLLYTNYKTFNNCYGIDCLANKGILYTKLEINNKIYHLMGIHLQANNKRIINIQLKKIKELYLCLKKKNKIKLNETVIIGGDFNIKDTNIINEQLNLYKNNYLNKTNELDHFYIINNIKNIKEIILETNISNPSDHKAIMIKIN